MVERGGETITPVAAYALASIIGPTVELGSMIVIPSPLAVISDRLNPNVVLGSLLINPEGANAVPNSRNFTYQLAGKIHRKYKPL